MARRASSDNLAARGVAERRRASEEAAAESNRRMEESRPTPTQEENDLAKVGALDIDAKEDDGSGEPLDPRQVNLEAEQRRRSAAADGNQSGYKTRDVKKD